MASIRQIEANRANAKRSTGPNTTAGKARSSGNALQHGLARPRDRADPDIARLVSVIISGFRHHGASEMVVDLARAKLELVRIRAARQQMLAALLDCPVPADAKRVTGLDRYERAALVRQRRALRFLGREQG
ncbi:MULTISPECIES: hypothetical protein [unclassified Bradyrhizobium]|uniref:hypothetical protein n=1 Tax=unclassified Bradyrhizobium TaxID=2631580 RepID=UPI001FFAE984|nr:MULTISPECIES: hypothetical protein [unclassified Bradyrhizobium]MCK1534549.1 hypothetical protein [Bradyrhizobium sp. 176]MCK1557247.1 hypothetical protein [Bradyrhizobium sp. 171]